MRKVPTKCRRHPAAAWNDPIQALSSVDAATVKLWMPLIMMAEVVRRPAVLRLTLVLGLGAFILAGPALVFANLLTIVGGAAG